MDEGKSGSGLLVGTGLGGLGGGQIECLGLGDQVAQKSTNTISLSVMVFSKSAEVMAVVAMMFPSFVFSLASPYGPHAWPPGDCLIHAIRLGAWGRAVRGRRLPAGYQLPSTTQHLCRIFRRRPNVSQDFAVR